MDLGEFLYDVKIELERRGYTVESDTIREVALRASVPNVRAKIETDEWTVEQVVAEIEEGVRGRHERQKDAGPSSLLNGLELPEGTTIEDFAEGGFNNDSSGEATRKARRQGFQLMNDRQILPPSQQMGDWFSPPRQDLIQRRSVRPMNPMLLPDRGFPLPQLFDESLRRGTT